MTVLRFELHSLWHAGSGRGDGAVADATILRSAGGLPYLPGRTIKGLVREACELGVAAGILGPERMVEWFGTAIVGASPDNRERKLEEARFRTVPGRLRFESATLGPEWEAWARQANRVGGDGPTPALLVRTLASTALEDGVAKDRSLRVIEAAVPMTLEGGVGGLDAGECEQLRAVLPFIRCLGSHRNRGLGRVTVTLEEV